MKILIHALKCKNAKKAYTVFHFCSLVRQLGLKVFSVLFFLLEHQIRWKTFSNNIHEISFSKNVPYFCRLISSFIKVSLEYVYSYIKGSLILYTQVRNATTPGTLVHIALTALCLSSDIYKLWQAAVLKPFKIQRCTLHFWKISIFF